jgi:GNAT superfamily N-acetyltransferase
MPDLTISLATSTELVDVYALFKQIVDAEFSWQEKVASYPAFLKSVAGEEIYVAKVAGKVCGFLTFWRADNFVHNLFVAKDWRKCGLATALLATVLATSKNAVYLKCVSHNHQALAFYRQAGWQIAKKCLTETPPYYLLVKKRC